MRGGYEEKEHESGHGADERRDEDSLAPKQAEQKTDVLESAKYYESVVLKDMEELRKFVDDAEELIPDQYLPYPTYGAMLFALR